MSKTTQTTAAARYDASLRRQRRPASPDAPQPAPTTDWPPENVILLEKYREWLYANAFSRNCIEQLYIPMAGHALGLNCRPHDQIALTDLDKAMDYIYAKQASQQWTTTCRHALARFRNFLRHERGLVTVAFPKPIDVSRYQINLPAWLVQELTQLQHIQQTNWRPARIRGATLRFWHSHTVLWQWLFVNYPIETVRDVKRDMVFAFIDAQLAVGYAVKTVNQRLRAFHATLRHLQERDHFVPMALMRIDTLREHDSLPRYLTDEQLQKLQTEVEAAIPRAKTNIQIRDAHFNRATFYLLWLGGMRLGEVEELQLSDLDLAQKRLTVRKGKGVQDRTVYLTDTTIHALNTYLTLRGDAQSDHLFIYRSKPLSKDIIRDRIKALGARTGIPVTPHQLRHSFATQLLNAGCHITTIQKLMGHKRINSTLLYARVHDKTVADDYFGAMRKIER